MDEVNELTPEEVKSTMNDFSNVVIVDVREDDEVAEGMIKGAKHIPLEKVPHSLDQFEEGKYYIFVCRSGRRSMMAATFVVEHGFNVASMEGGMLDWEGELEK